MADEAITTQGEEVTTPTDEGTAKTPTIADLIGQTEVEEPKEEPKTVGLDKFLEEKKARKALEKEVKDLKKLVEEGGTKQEVDASIESIAEEYPDVDPKFLSKLAQAIEAKTNKSVDDKISSKIKPIEEKDKMKEVKTAFSKGFGEALKEMPEYQNIVNEDVIFKLSLLRENGNKTFAQLIEETYSNALGGKRTMETTTPRGGKEPESLDFDKARSNTEYFKEVMNNPKLKAEYNDKMIKRGF